MPSPAEFSLDPALRARVEALLPEYLPRCRWFRSKTREIASARLEATAPLGQATGFPVLAVVRTEYRDGGSERYALPLTFLPENTGSGFPDGARIGTFAAPGGERILCDASWDAGFRAALFDLLSGAHAGTLDGGTLRGRPVAGGRLPEGRGNASRVLGAEQSNTSARYDSGHFAKIYRKLGDGVNPEPEVLRFLREHTAYRHVPEFASALEWARAGDDAPITVALLVDFVAADGDAWKVALKRLAEVFASGDASLPESFAAWIRLLGKRTGELHDALASRPDVAAFAPEPLTAADLERVRSGIRAQLTEAFEALQRRLDELSPETKLLANGVTRARGRLESLLDFDAKGDLGRKIRAHGDLHLGQILVTGDDVCILDFEGEPGRPLSEARRRQSPLRDAAGMLRSFHYAAHTAARAAGKPGDAPRLADALCDRFLSGYLPAAATAGLPADAGARDSLLRLFVIEKAVYELLYELNNRPDWVEIPLDGLAALTR